MAIREYKCPSCGVLSERIVPTSQTPDATIPCPKCGEASAFRPIPSSIGLLTDSFQEQKIDVAIGKDADRRWQDVEARQQIRDKVRRDSGRQGVSMVGRNEFVPITEADKVARSEAADVVSVEGFKHQPDTTTDQKLVGSD